MTPLHGSHRLPRASALVALAVVLVLATGCAAIAARHAARLRDASLPSGATTIPTGSTTQTISVLGVPRTFIVYRPADLRGEVPLVVMMHGGYGSATQAQKAYGWDEEADTGRFIVAYPDGSHRAWNVGGGCCGKPGAQDVDDVGFITQMVSTIRKEVSIDPRRIFATGISNGGMMAYRLACDTTIFAAIGPDSATLLGKCPNPAPISVIHIHGTADTKIPYLGGIGSGPSHIDGPSIPSLNATWRAIDRCGAPSVTTAGVVTTSIARCPQGHTVELITIAGAGHQWPGATDTLAQRLIGADTPSKALRATSVIWAFFASHPKPA